MARLLHAALVVAVASLPGRAPVGSAAIGEPPRALRAVTYNVLHGGPLSGLSGNDEELEARFRIAVAELRALDPDLVGLQEASVSRRRGNIAARLARELGFHYAHASALFRLTPLEWLNRQISRVMNFAEGPAVLSRYPIVARRVYDLPRCSGALDPRVLLHVTVRTPWGELGVASTHTTRGFCEAARVAELMSAVRGPLPSILMGDFNADEASSGIRRLTEESGLVDVFRVANRSAPGFTVWQPVRTPVPMVRRRVDFVFMLPGREVPGRVLGSRVVLDTPARLEDGGVLWPSDHYGVLAELAVFPGWPAAAGRPPPPSRSAVPE